MENIEVTIQLLAYGGDGMGRLADGRAVFIPFTLPGERVLARLVEEKRGHARAELVEVLQAAPQRIAPRCAHFGVCGGCHYQHMSYDAQLAFKTGILRDQMERIGGIKDAPLLPAVGSPKAFNYRNHVQFHLSPEGKLGFLAARQNQVVATRECHLPEAALNEVWPLLDLEPVPGVERVGLRLGRDDEVQLILEGREPEALEFSVEELDISAVQLGPGGAMVLAGSETLPMEVLGRPFQVSAGSFFQVNTAMAEAMVQHLLEHLPVSAGDTVLDIYSGVGLFSAFFAERAGRIVAVEVEPSACQDYVVNLDEFDNVELYEAPTEIALGSMDFHPQVAIVDPPRAGLEGAALEALLRQQPQRLAYVSCDPATLARDARRLTAGGYRLAQITPFDLFPQTYHIESISIFIKQ